MKPFVAATRLLGLIRVIFLKVVSPGQINFDASLMISPIVRVTVGRGSLLRFAKSVSVSYGADICAVNGGEIHIGKNTYMGPRCMLSSHGSITIGDSCLFGPDVKIFDNDHEFLRDVGVVRERYRVARIAVGNNVWCGANVVLLRGVNIGDGAVIGAGCVVRQDVAPGAVIRSTADSERSRAQ